MNNSITHETNVSITTSPCWPTNLPVALKTTTCSPTNLEPSQRIDLVCRYGAHFDATSKFGDPAWRIDLYRRDAIISGFALQCDIERFPNIDALVQIEGIVIQGGESTSIWVRSWEPIETLPPQDCIFDTALPNWITDRNIVARACRLWASLPAEDLPFRQRDLPRFPSPTWVSCSAGIVRSPPRP